MNQVKRFFSVLTFLLTNLFRRTKWETCDVQTLAVGSHWENESTGEARSSLLLDRWDNLHICFIHQHCLYQRFSCSSCKWRRVPANAKCDHQTCGRQSSSISQHLHLKTLYSSLFQVDKTHDNFIHWQASFFSKQILKAKLLLAIKTKNFGFVWKSVYYSESWKSCEGFLFISKPKPVNNYVNFVKADLPS